MKAPKNGTRSNRSSTSTTTRDIIRRREERYHLIAEIAASRKQADSYIEYAYGSNWDDR